MLNWVLSLMVHEGKLTEEKAVFLAKELPQKIHSSDFATCHKIVEKLLTEFESKNK